MDMTKIREPAVDLRARLAGLAALLTAAAMIAARLVSGAAPEGLSSAATRVWYQRHAGLLGWRALALTVAAIGLMAFAAAFRERTWAAVPDRLWSGTLMVLAALGYASLTSVAAAVDYALLQQITPTSTPSSDLIGFALSMDRALLVVATPALIVVLAASTLPLVRWGRAGKVTAAAAIPTSAMLAMPPMWAAGLWAAAGWFALAGVVVMLPSRGTGRTVSRTDAPSPAELFGD